MQQFVITEHVHIESDEQPKTIAPVETKRSLTCTLCRTRPNWVSGSCGQTSNSRWPSATGPCRCQTCWPADTSCRWHRWRPSPSSSSSSSVNNDGRRFTCARSARPRTNVQATHGSTESFRTGSGGCCPCDVRVVCNVVVIIFDGKIRVGERRN